MFKRETFSVRDIDETRARQINPSWTGLKRAAIGAAAVDKGQRCRWLVQPATASYVERDLTQVGDAQEDCRAVG